MSVKDTITLLKLRGRGFRFGELKKGMGVLCFHPERHRLMRAKVIELHPTHGIVQFETGKNRTFRVSKGHIVKREKQRR